MMRARNVRRFACGWAVLLGAVVPSTPRAEAAVAASPAATESVAHPGFVQTGVASWYGGSFHGRRTASGEIFDSHQLTVAHPTLPLGSVVEITNLENGRSAVARINDRGPFVRPRIIDCSHAVANALGFVADGLANVRVRVLDSLRPHRVEPRTRDNAVDEDTAPANPRASEVTSGTGFRAEPKFCVQLGAFRDPSNAQVLMRRASILPHPVFVYAARAVRQVLVGPFNNVDAATTARRDLRLAGLTGFVRLYEEPCRIALADSPANSSAPAGAGLANTISAGPSTLSQ